MRTQAWQHYFATGDKEPLVLAYQKSIEYIAWDRFRCKEDMVQIGFIGLLKAIDKIDLSRVKSVDAWVFLNVRGEMLKARRWPRTESLDKVIDDEGTTFYDLLVAPEEDWDIRIDLLNALKKSGNSDELIEALWEHKPLVENNVAKYVSRYQSGELSLRGLARELGLSRRQAYLLVGELPESWLY